MPHASPVSPSRLTRYRHSLGGFTKVHIGAGAATSVDISIPARNLAHWDPKSNGGSHTVDPGLYSLFVCHDSRIDTSNTAEGIDAPPGKCIGLSVTL